MKSRIKSKSYALKSPLDNSSSTGQPSSSTLSRSRVLRPLKARRVTMAEKKAKLK